MLIQNMNIDQDWMCTRTGNDGKDGDDDGPISFNEYYLAIRSVLGHTPTEFREDAVVVSQRLESKLTTD